MPRNSKPDRRQLCFETVPQSFFDSVNDFGSFSLVIFFSLSSSSKDARPSGTLWPLLSTHGDKNPCRQGSQVINAIFVRRRVPIPDQKDSTFATAAACPNNDLTTVGRWVDFSYACSRGIGISWNLSVLFLYIVNSATNNGLYTLTSSGATVCFSKIASISTHKYSQIAMVSASYFSNPSGSLFPPRMMSSRKKADVDRSRKAAALETIRILPNRGGDRRSGKPLRVVSGFWKFSMNLISNCRGKSIW